MKYKINNKGMTLMELIIALAISMIVLSMIAVFINVASKSFNKTNNDVKLQMEAQVAINQLSNLAMEAKEIKPLLGVSEPNCGYCIVGYNDSNTYAVIYTSDNQKLYLIKTNQENILNINYSDDNDLLAEYVSGIQMTQADSNKKTEIITLSLAVGMGNNRHTYTVSRKIKLRNA